MTAALPQINLTTISSSEHLAVHAGLQPLFDILAETGPNRPRHVELVVLALLLLVGPEERANTLEYLNRVSRELLN